MFGQSPVENAAVLGNICFIKESQSYPEDFRPKHVFASAPWFFQNWDAEFADRLIADFRLPLNRRIKKLSRGQLSAVGVIVGLASRAPLTFFDEPYLGLDAVARQIFYDRLLEDFAEHPRTVILSTHLIDEVSALLEHVIVIDDGRIIIDENADALRGSATTISGTRAAVDAFVGARTVLHREGLGGLASVTVESLDRRRPRLRPPQPDSNSVPVSLQQLIVRKTSIPDNRIWSHSHDRTLAGADRRRAHSNRRAASSPSTRLHFVNRFGIIWMPLIVLAGSSC